jgi:hypothetical protein
MSAIGGKAMSANDSKQTRENEDARKIAGRLLRKLLKSSKAMRMTSLF